jgi:Family of unknown function (DUF6221)
MIIPTTGRSGLLTDPIVAFAEARLAEDEAAAKAAGDGSVADYRWREVDPVRQPGLIGTGKGDVVTFNRGTAAYAVSPSPGQAAHIARQDPASTLRDIKGKRQIVEDYRVACSCVGGSEHALVTEILAAAVRNLLLRWADHPGYQKEAWKP